MSIRRISIPLTDAEISELRDLARREFRRPQDQAKYIIVSALGLATEATGQLAMNNGAPLLATQVLAADNS